MNKAILPLIAAIAILALNACASATRTYGPDGTPAYVINCSGPYLNWDACYSKANKVCGAQSYTVLSRTRHNAIEDLPNAAALMAASGPSPHPVSTAQAVGESMQPTNVVNRYLEVSCNPGTNTP